MNSFKIQLINFLKGHFIKLLLKKILGSAVAGGFKAWIVKLIATELFEEVGEPVIRLAMRKGQLLYDKAAGRIILRKIENAKEENNRDAYSDSISNV